MRIGIIILATNSYFILGIRFIKRFLHYYKGDKKITFFFFSDENPVPYLKNDTNIQYYFETHENWACGTNSKFKNILRIKEQLKKEVDYIYYFDADTNVDNPFTEEWFIGDLVGGEHYGNRNFLSDGKGFDRNPKSTAYVPLDSKLPYTYHYGAFFGGKTDNVIRFCEILQQNQMKDKEINYEPGANDESYINQYFHINPPTYTVATEKFMFGISDKGGIGETRNPSLSIEGHKKMILENKDKTFNLQNNIIIWL